VDKSYAGTGRETIRDPMFKRIIDLLAAGGGLLVLCPLLAVLALAVKGTSPGPVFFRQERVGRGGRGFRILKFRTMVADAERRGLHITAGGDPRVTPVGRLLRHYKMDELPQLWNVLVGDMSLVGPRPEVAKYVALYSSEQRRVLEVRPGITDPASLAYRHEEALLARAADPERFYVETVMPAKLRINLDYINHRTFVRDLIVLLRTVHTSAKG
jgi:lipopolysaccharide/colanic/teichoic acid biosynthesis glycosyltransferase